MGIGWSSAPAKSAPTLPCHPSRSWRRCPSWQTACRRWAASPQRTCTACATCASPTWRSWRTRARGRSSRLNSQVDHPSVDIMPVHMDMRAFSRSFSAQMPCKSCGDNHSCVAACRVCADGSAYVHVLVLYHVCGQWPAHPAHSRHQLQSSMNALTGRLPRRRCPVRQGRVPDARRLPGRAARRCGPALRTGSRAGLRGGRRARRAGAPDADGADARRACRQADGR